MRVLLRSHHHQRRTTAADELGWLLSDDRIHPFAFRTICEMLDIDPDRLRRRVLDAREPRMRVSSAAPVVAAFSA